MNDYDSFQEPIDEDWDDGRERGDEPRMYPQRICEGKSVPHAHSSNVLEYRYLTECGESEPHFLCDRCVAYERANGLVLERTFIEEGPFFGAFSNWTFYPNPGENDDV